MDIKVKSKIPVLDCVFARHDEIKDWKFGRKFLNFIKSNYPQLFPEYAHYYEPINVPVPEENSIEHMRPYWEADGTMWARRKNIRSFGHWFNRVYPIFPDGMFKFLWTIQYDPKLNTVKFFADIIRVFKPDFACIAVETVTEKNLSELDEHVHRAQTGRVCIRTYKEKMRALGWAQHMSNEFMNRYFGDDMERVANLTKADLGIETVKRTKAGLYWQLTPSPYDLEEDILAFTELRKRVQTIIGNQYFSDPRELWEEQFKQPDFSNSIVGIVPDPNDTAEEQDSFTQKVIAAIKKSMT